MSDLIDRKINKEILDQIERDMRSIETIEHGNNSNCELEHRFAGGMYLRTIKVPAGMWIMSKIHLHEHPVFVEKGTALVFSEENGEELVEAPLTIISKKGVKRMVYALTDLIWTTVHLNIKEERDIDKLEKNNVVETEQEFIDYKTKQIG